MAERRRLSVYERITKMEENIKQKNQELIILQEQLKTLLHEKDVLEAGQLLAQIRKQGLDITVALNKLQK